METDPFLLQNFFHACTRVFEQYNIQDEFKIPIIMPLINNKTRLLLTSLPKGDVDTFDNFVPLCAVNLN